jgi:hypothetical protein
MTAESKSLSPLRRREQVGHDELVAYWRDAHAPTVKAHMRPDRYSITFFDPRDGKAPFDGMAAIAFADADRARAVSGRNMPSEVVGDGFGERIELPMLRVQVTEHVIVPGPHGGPASVAEREAAYKLTFLVSPRPGVDVERVHRHWLEAHAPNVASAFVASGGVRYVVNLAASGSAERPFAGVAELWYQDREAARSHRIADDGFVALTDGIALPGREHVVTA